MKDYSSFWSAPCEFEPSDEYYSELMEFYDSTPTDVDPRLNQIMTFGAILAYKRQREIYTADYELRFENELEALRRGKRF